jgi:hypothetical protein
MYGVLCGRLRGESIVPGQEFAVLSGENVVGYCCYREAGTELCAEREHEGSLSGADGSGGVSIPL